MLLGRRFGFLVLVITSFYLYVNGQAPVETPIDEVYLLAKQLVAGPTDTERQELINAHKNLVTPKFFQQLITLVNNDSDRERGLKTLLFAEPLSKRIGNDVSWIEISKALGRLFLKSGKYDGAAQRFSDLRDALSTEELTSGKVLLEIGDIYMRERHFKDSLRWFNLARDFLKSSPGGKNALDLQAKASIGIAAANSELGHYYDVLEPLDVAERLFTKTENLRGLSSVKNEYGIVYDLLHNSRASANAYNQAVEILKNLEATNPGKYKSDIATLQVNIGLLQTLSLGMPKEALENFEKAESILNTPDNDASMASLYGNKAIALRKLGRFEQGLVFSKKSLDLFLASLSIEANPDEIANAYNQLANSQLDVGLLDPCLENTNKAITIAPQNREIEWNALTTKGRVLIIKKQYNEAKASLDKAISIVDELSDESIGDDNARSAYFSGMLYPYQYIVDLLIQQGNYESALIYAERSKAKGLLHALQGERNDFKKGMSEDQKEKEQLLVDQLTTANSEVNKISQNNTEKTIQEKADLVKRRDEKRFELENFRLRLFGSIPALRSRRSDLKIKSPLELNNIFKDSGAVGLHYVVTPERVSLLVVSRGSNGKLRVFGQPLRITGLELSSLVNKFHAKLENARGGFNSDSQDLYNALIKPVEDQIAGKKTIIIVPDDILWNLPFQALIDHQQKYFIENHPLFYAPSLSALSQIINNEKSHSKNYIRPLLAMGNPDLGIKNDGKIATIRGEPFGPIPQAEDEVTQICQIFNNCSYPAYLGRSATEMKLKKGSTGSRIIHLAAHGFLDSSSPLYSFVVLSQTSENDQEDGIFETWELMNMDLRSTEMLVLSACETGRGELRPGEGIIGLSWAAAIAGVPATVVSEWKVDASSTTLLMRGFYKNLFSSKVRNVNQPTVMSKAEAMQKAMIEFIKPVKPKKSLQSYKHPFFWAGFDVIGNGL